MFCCFIFTRIFDFMVQERNLSEEERKWILELVAGRKTKEVAKMYGLPQGTLAFKMNNVRSRFCAKNIAELVYILCKEGKI